MEAFSYFPQAKPRRRTQNRKRVRFRLRRVSLAYLGFDTNDYPGDPLLPELRRTFSFAGYWLNNPPGATSNTWMGKRETLSRRGFGFLILFNGRTYSQLKSPNRPDALGASDGRAAAETALREGFPKNAVIFLDQEEGGRLLPDQNTYLFAWIDAVIWAGFRRGSLLLRDSRERRTRANGRHSQRHSRSCRNAQDFLLRLQRRVPSVAGLCVREGTTGAISEWCAIRIHLADRAVSTPKRIHSSLQHDLR